MVRSQARKTFVVLLRCHHHYSFDNPPPKIGETVWCQRCQQYQPCIQVNPEYYIKCITCGWGKRFGAAHLNAEIGATKHRINRAHHTVKLYKGSKLIYVFGKSNLQLTIESLEPPPF